MFTSCLVYVVDLGIMRYVHLLPCACSGPGNEICSLPVLRLDLGLVGNVHLFWTRSGSWSDEIGSPPVLGPLKTLV